MFGSECIAALFAAKIMLFTLVFILNGLLPWYEFFTDGVFFQGVTHRHFLHRFFLPATYSRWLIEASCYQPIGQINQDGDDNYP